MDISISPKTYLIAGLGAALIFFFLSLVGGEAMAGFFNQHRANAIATGMSPVLANVIVDPMIFVLSNPIIAAIAAFLLWPLVVFWLFLNFVMIIFAMLSAGAGAARGGITPGN